MVNIKKIVKYITDKDYRFLVNSSYGFYNNLSDEEYIKRRFKSTIGYIPNLNSPQTFNEKLQWLKLYDRDDLYTVMVDKYKVRDYIKEKIGEEYLIPLIGVWNSTDEINYDSLPNQFVLKCNHNSGLGISICKDKSKFDFYKAKKEIDKALKQDYYLTGREWPYKNVDRKIIAEKFMSDASGEDIQDYKFFCFNGMVKVILVCSERFSKTGLKENFYDIDWNLLKVKRPNHEISNKIINKPVNFNKMKELAEKLSKDIPFLRVDFYEINNKIYFGELTFFPASGFARFEPDSFDRYLGDMLILENKLKR